MSPLSNNKTLRILMTVQLFSFIATAAFAGDEIMMATSEDLSAFDESLGESNEWIRAAVPGEKRNKANTSANISAESRKLRNSTLEVRKNSERGLRAQAQAREHGASAINSAAAPGKGLGKGFPESAAGRNPQVGKKPTK